MPDQSLKDVFTDKKIAQAMPAQSFTLITEKPEMFQSLTTELTLPKDSNIFASKYELYLPSKEELKKQLVAAIENMEEGDRDV